MTISSLLSNISLTLNITLEFPDDVCQASNICMVQFAKPHAKVINIKWQDDPTIYENDDFIPITEEQLSSIGINKSEMMLGPDYSENKRRYTASNGQYFTIKEVLDCVLDSEKYFRPLSEWFNGVDLHHRFFEGVRQRNDGSFYTLWGS